MRHLGPSILFAATFLTGLVLFRDGVAAFFAGSLTATAAAFAQGQFVNKK